MRSFPVHKQLNQADCGPTCLKIVATYFGRDLDIEYLRNKSNITKGGTSLFDLSETSENIGFKATAARITFETLKEVQLPCVAHWNGNHFIVVYKINKHFVFVSDPAHGLLKYTHEEFKKSWINASQNSEGYILVLDPTAQFFKGILTAAEPLGFSFLIPYIKRYRASFLQLFLGLALGSIIQLILPFITQSMVDYGINYHNIHFVYIILIAQLTLFLSQSTVDVIQSWILLHVSSRIQIHLLSDFLRKLMRLPISFFDSRNTGDIIQRIYDVNRIQNFLSNTTLTILFQIFNLVIFGAVLAYYSIQIFSIFLVGSIFYVSWTFAFLKRRKDLDYKRFTESSQNQSNLVQLIAGMQEMKLNGSERRRRWEWESIQVRLFNISIKSLSITQAQTAGSLMLFRFQNIIITFLAVRGVIMGEITLGMMLSIQYIIGQLSAPIFNFVSFVQNVQDAKISLSRLSEVHNKEEEITEFQFENNFPLPERKTIQVNNLSFRYGGTGSQLVLDSIHFEIPEAKVTAIVGGSGSGKTTLLKLLLRFYEPSSGTITVDNKDLRNINLKEWRQNCGVVMQDGYIFNDTILKNVTESDSEHNIDYQRLEEAIRIANLQEFIGAQINGLNTIIGTNGTNISGGQRQRVLLARSIYKQPAYFFLDEATSSLDSQNENLIMQNLNTFFKGKTVIIIAHRLSTVKSADNIVVLNNGSIVEQGSHDALIERGEYYFRLMQTQLVSN